ncbi:hypothetical protein FHY03_001769 [Sphingomonas sp. BK345]|nr:hypothetical protein [Sphingomonas sp. BK345]
MRSVFPLELIGAHRCKRATFTSYVFSATFVEAVSRAERRLA